MKVLSQLGPVVFASLVPLLVYSAVIGLSNVVTLTNATLIVWVAMVLAAMLMGWALDEYLVQREAIVAAMKRFGQTFVREFERPLLQANAAERSIQSQLRAIPDRRRLEILLSPCGDHRYPNLADHKTNVLYDVTRVLEHVRDRRFVCEPVFARGSWVVVPFQFRMNTKQAGGQ